MTKRDLFPDKAMTSDEFRRLTCQWDQKLTSASLKIDEEAKARCRKVKRDAAIAQKEAVTTEAAITTPAVKPNLL